MRWVNDKEKILIAALEERVQSLERQMKMVTKGTYFWEEVPMRDVVYAIVKHLGMSIKRRTRSEEVYLVPEKGEKE